jgi:hypothetical protein
MNIDWRVIPHKEQRYPTVGDWWWDNAVLHLRVSKMSDIRYELLVGLHELIEVMLCEFAKVSQSDSDKFDEEFEATRENLIQSGLFNFETLIVLPCGCALKKSHELEYEPGDDPHAPYNKQHQIASVCERALAFFLGVNWGEYEREVETL